MAKDKQYGSATLTREEPAKKTVVTTTPVVKTVPEVSTVRRTSVAEPDRRHLNRAAALPFGRRNYTLMLVGIGVILAGFFIMSLDKEEFGFGFLGLTLGPIVVMSGFMLEFRYPGPAGQNAILVLWFGGLSVWLFICTRLVVD